MVTMEYSLDFSELESLRLFPIKRIKQLWCRSQELLYILVFHLTKFVILQDYSAECEF